jgi:hypothetical protein
MSRGERRPVRLDREWNRAALARSPVAGSPLRRARRSRSSRKGVLEPDVSGLVPRACEDPADRLLQIVTRGDPGVRCAIALGPAT